MSYKFNNLKVSFFYHTKDPSMTYGFALFKGLFNKDLLTKNRNDEAALTFKLFMCGFKFGSALI